MCRYPSANETKQKNCEENNAFLNLYMHKLRAASHVKLNIYM